MAGEDNTQIDREIQILVNRLDGRIATSDLKRKVLENAKVSEIEALKKDRREARRLKSSLLYESAVTRLEIANVDGWLNQKTLLSGEDQDEGYIFSVLIVDDDLTARDTNRRLMMSVETQNQLTMEFQEAKNGKEAVYLHLAGASYDLILMKNDMPIMTGIQTSLHTSSSLPVHVSSLCINKIVGVSSESDHQAFMDAGLDNCIQKPLDTAKITAFLSDPIKRKGTDTSQGWGFLF
ncbi:hybrid signal transduction histidine kinase [Salix suchowensis]|nr:hybrid signal transduction histidine kinase [Salix suchowensis]